MSPAFTIDGDTARAVERSTTRVAGGSFRVLCEIVDSGSRLCRTMTVFVSSKEIAVTRKTPSVELAGQDAVVNAIIRKRHNSGSRFLMQRLYHDLFTRRILKATKISA
jgi:hypothetical protein